MKLISIFSVALLPIVVWGARFKPTTGGYLDNAENWDGDLAVLAVAAAQSGPLQISANGVSLPDGSGKLNYWTYVYTNDFGSSMTLNMQGKPLIIDQGATLYQISGCVDASNSASYITGNSSPARFVLSGSSSSFLANQLYIDASGQTPIANSLEVRDGARVALDGALFVSGGYNAAAVVVSGSGSKLSSDTKLLIGSSAMHSGNNNVQDVPGVKRVVCIEKGATASFSEDTSIGQQSGGCELLLKEGSQFTTKNLILAENLLSGNTGTTNNEVVISSAGLKTTELLIVGKNGSNNSVTVSGEESLLEVGGKMFVGGHSTTSLEVMPSHNLLSIENGATAKIEDDIHVGIVGGDGNTLRVAAHGVLAAKSISLYSGSSLVVNDAQLDLTNGIAMAGSGSVGSTAAFTNASVTLGKNLYSEVGGNSSVVEFYDSRISVLRRWTIKGNDFTMRLNNSLLNYDDPADWFITGGTGTESADLKRRFVFEGANPHLKISGSKGVFLRGGVELVFNLGENGYPADHAVIELTNAEAVFNGNDLYAHRVMVNVSDKCPSGLYTLMKGKNCSTFLGENAYSVEPSRHRLIKTKENGVDVLKVRVLNSSSITIVIR